MRFIIVILFSLLFAREAHSQYMSYPFYQLYQLDSIGQSPSIGRHFGELYFYFLGLVEKRLENADTSTQKLVRHFETVFAQFYIDACMAYQKNELIALPAWRAYFNDSTLSGVQYNLLGTNAHLNGGLSEAIAGSYTPAQWKNLKKKYVLFNKCLNTTFRRVYGESMAGSKPAKALSIITFGLTRVAGNLYLYKWRRRQMRLTGYYYIGSPKYKILLARINRKKAGIDKLVIKLI
jgi:hypothetical protein